MKIQIWSDFRCPFCYIGKRNLEKALETLEGNFEIEMMSYELDPNFKPNGKSMVESLAEKYGMSVEEAKNNQQRVIDMAKQAGLNYDFDRLIDVNSLRVHKVFQYAKTQNLGNEFAESVLSAHFEKGMDMDDVETLVKLGLEVGLDEAGIRNAFESEDYLYSVKQDVQWAQMVGVKGVPHFVLDNAVSLSGAQSPETFKDAIAFTIEQTAKLSQFSAKNDTVCDDDGCAI